MSPVAILPAGLVLAAVLWLVGRAALGAPRVPALSGVVPLDPSLCPAVTIVVAARDEARGVERGLRSLLAQDHPRLRVVAVDDRSSDGTAAILDRLAAGDARLEILHVTELPAGWLGKCHALARGAERAGSEWLLFTDADVVLEPGALRRALALAADRGLDHLTAGPGVSGKGFWLNVYLSGFTTLFGLWVAPWAAADPKSRVAIGIGAFNLVRAAAYRAVGGHSAIRLFPDDDLELGRRLKNAGFRQMLAGGRDCVEVEWYPSVRAAARGLEKNIFSAFEFRLPLGIAGLALLLALHVTPFVAAPLASGPARWLWAAAALAQVGAAAGAGLRTGIPLWAAPLLPLAVLQQIAISVRAMAINLREGGIRWRETFYPLAALRAARRERPAPRR